MSGLGMSTKGVISRFPWRKTIIFWPWRGTRNETRFEPTWCCAEEWRWSSFWTRCCGSAEEKAVLAEWPLELPRDWVERVNRADNEKELDALRCSVQRGRPYGASEWQRQIAKRLGLESAYRSDGRPRIVRRSNQFIDPE